MRTNKVNVLAVLVAGALMVTNVGCGESKPAAKVAKVEAGSMPADGSWRGVYFDPLFGYLHIEEKGDLVEGRWIRPRKDQWGKLEGKVEGNLLRFEWEEYIDGLVGPNSKKSGKGYFVYKRPPGENVDDIIEGEIGRGEDEVGFAPWKGIKQRNVEPDVASIGGSGAADVGGGDWDTENTEVEEEVEEPVDPDEGGGGGDVGGPEL